RAALRGGPGGSGSGGRGWRSRPRPAWRRRPAEPRPLPPRRSPRRRRAAFPGCAGRPRARTVPEGGRPPSPPPPPRAPRPATPRATGRLTSAKRRITPYHPESFSESCSDLSHCRRSTKGLVPDIEREAVSGHRPGIALAVILACQLVMVLDGTIVNIALPEIQHGLGLTDAGRSWVVNAYLLTFGGLLLLGGRAGDI